jgi:hypothetical protein
VVRYTLGQGPQGCCSGFGQRAASARSEGRHGAEVSVRFRAGAGHSPRVVLAARQELSGSFFGADPCGVAFRMLTTARSTRQPTGAMNRFGRDPWTELPNWLLTTTLRPRDRR